MIDDDKIKKFSKYVTAHLDPIDEVLISDDGGLFVINFNLRFARGNCETLIASATIHFDKISNEVMNSFSVRDFGVPVQMIDEYFESLSRAQFVFKSLMKLAMYFKHQLNEII